MSLIFNSMSIIDAYISGRENYKKLSKFEEFFLHILRVLGFYCFVIIMLNRA